MSNLQDIKSKLELQIESGATLNIGDEITYSDSSNYEEFVVTEFFDGGFLVKNDSSERDLWFGNIQCGWSLNNN